MIGGARVTLSSQLGSLRSVGASNSVEFVQVRAELCAIATAIRQLDIYQESTLDAVIEPHRRSNS